MGLIEGPPAPKRIPVSLFFLFQNVSYLDINSQQVKFERKAFVSSISMDLP